MSSPEREAVHAQPESESQVKAYHQSAAQHVLALIRLATGTSNFASVQGMKLSMPMPMPGTTRSTSFESNPVIGEGGSGSDEQSWSAISSGVTTATESRRTSDQSGVEGSKSTSGCADSVSPDASSSFSPGHSLSPPAHAPTQPLSPLRNETQPRPAPETYQPQSPDQLHHIISSGDLTPSLPPEFTARPNRDDLNQMSPPFIPTPIASGSNSDIQLYHSRLVHTPLPSPPPIPATSAHPRSTKVFQASLGGLTRDEEHARAWDTVGRKVWRRLPSGFQLQLKLHSKAGEVAPGTPALAPASASASAFVDRTGNSAPTAHLQAPAHDSSADRRASISTTDMDGGATNASRTETDAGAEVGTASLAPRSQAHSKITSATVSESARAVAGVTTATNTNTNTPGTSNTNHKPRSSHDKGQGQGQGQGQRLRISLSASTMSSPDPPVGDEEAEHEAYQARREARMKRKEASLRLTIETWLGEIPHLDKQDIEEMPEIEPTLPSPSTVLRFRMFTTDSESWIPLSNPPLFNGIPGSTSTMATASFGTLPSRRVSTTSLRVPGPGPGPGSSSRHFKDTESNSNGARRQSAYSTYSPVSISATGADARSTGKLARMEFPSRSRSKSKPQLEAVSTSTSLHPHPVPPKASEPRKEKDQSSRGIEEDFAGISLRSGEGEKDSTLRARSRSGVGV